jgi:spermidine/putrescine-binding protein
LLKPCGGEAVAEWLSQLIRVTVLSALRIITMEIVMPRFLALFALTLAPLLAQADEVISVYNWNFYIAPQVLIDFEKETGIRVDYHTYNSVAELEKLLASDEPIDVTVASYELLPKLIKSGTIRPLDNSQLPNRRHLDKQILNKLAAFDANNRYAAPYLWGSAGLAINTVEAEKAFGGPLPDSWSVLFDPEQSSRLASCGISMLNEPATVLSALMNYQGRNLASSAPRQIKRLGESINLLQPNLRYVDSQRYIGDLASGKLCLALAYVGDALAAAKAGQPVKFIIPQEGASVFIDNWVIPKNTRRADLAHRFINYLMEPKVAALITTEILYPSANADAKAFLDPALRDQPGLFPDSATKRRLFVLDLLPEKQADIRNTIWTNFINGLNPVAAQ